MDIAHQNGSVAELTAATFMVKRGYDVYFPITINPKADFIATKDDETLKVQVKKASWSRTGNFKYLQVRVIGKLKGDYQRVYKLNDFDVLMVVDSDTDRIWYIPVEEVVGRTSLYLDTTNPNPRVSNRNYNPATWLV